MTTDELRAARHAWAHAQVELDTCMTRILPAALAEEARGGKELEQLLTPEQTHEISRLYGATVGLWARYREMLRHVDDAPS